MITLHGIKTCDTCRKALKELPNAILSDVRKDGVPIETLVKAQEKFGEKLINKRSTTWRSLSESDRSTGIVDLLVAHPTVMKRPLIEYDGDLLLGWDAQTRAALGLE